MSQVENDYSFVENGQVRWFGVGWGAPINDPAIWIDTPADVNCATCAEPIEPGDQGMRVPAVVTSPFWCASDVEPYVHFPELSYLHYHLLCWLDVLGVRNAAENPMIKIRGAVT
jgi:hypothetical protein